MERMLVVVFDDEKRAYEGSRALHQLDGDGSIAIHAESVIEKKADGTAAVKQAEGDFPIRTLEGTALGGLVGLLAGPVGLAVGAGAGLMVAALTTCTRLEWMRSFWTKFPPSWSPASARWSPTSARSG
jgi:uncharacterized membrane protein